MGPVNFSVAACSFQSRPRPRCVFIIVWTTTLHRNGLTETVHILVAGGAPSTKIRDRYHKSAIKISAIETVKFIAFVGFGNSNEQ